MIKAAVFSPCRKYRYSLTRIWDDSLPSVVFCGLNPSTADETLDDPTIRREMGFARDWGMGGLVKVNAYALRSTDPKGLWQVDDPRGPDNFLTIRAHCHNRQAMFVAAWGNNIRDRDAFELRRMLRLDGVKVHALKLTKTGNPQHPLYLPKSATPFEWGHAAVVNPCQEHGSLIHGEWVKP